MKSIKLLDCTLRDGGYVNGWSFGHDSIAALFERLVSSRVDIIELGFLDEKHEFDLDRTIQKDTGHLRQIYEGLDKGGAMTVAMIDYGTCPVSHVEPREESGIDGIRVIFKKEKMDGALRFCEAIKELGYALFIQAVSITSYDDDTFFGLLDRVNAIEPYAFSLVDTYGLLHKEQLKHYFDLADERLKPSIGIGYHSHNNFQLGYANCIELIESGIQRELIIDGSLYGMGKSAGNTPIELLAAYLNDVHGGDYRLYQLLEAIDSTILDIYRRNPWGYSFQYFVSASHDCHPGYVSYLMEKKKLSMKAIDSLLDRVPAADKLNYDRELIEGLYLEYQKVSCEDAADYAALAEELGDEPVLLLGPGRNIISQRERAARFQEERGPRTIAVNCVPEGLDVDYVFISNAKRYVHLASKLNRGPIRNGKSGNAIKVMATSNVTEPRRSFQFTFRYGDLLDEDALMADNSLVMLVRLLMKAGVGKVWLAGFDGYVRRKNENYMDPKMEYAFIRPNADAINQDTVKSLKRLSGRIEVEFLTDSIYEGLLADAEPAEEGQEDG